MLHTEPRNWLPQVVEGIVSVTLKDLHKSLYERHAQQRHLLFALLLIWRPFGVWYLGEKIITNRMSENYNSKFH